MATEIKLRRGTKAQHDDGSGFTGAEGEVTVDTTDDTLRVHDGSLKGGHVIAKLSDVEASDTLAEMSDVDLTNPADGSLLKYDNASSKWIDSAKLTETATGIDVTGTVTADGVKLGDNEKIQLGDTANPDLEIYHNGSHSVIDVTGTGNLILTGSTVEVKNSDNNVKIVSEDGATGAVKLSHGNTQGEQLATTATGINVTGELTTDSIRMGTDQAITFNTDNSNYSQLKRTAAGNTFLSEVGSGEMIIQGQSLSLRNEDSDVIYRHDANAAELYHRNGDNAGIKLQTTNAGIDVTGTVTADGVSLANDKRITLGAEAGSNYLEIFESSTGNGVIKQVGAGDFAIQGHAIQVKDDDGNLRFQGTNGALGNAFLYYGADATPKLNTVTNGINVTGTVTADGLDLGDAGVIRLGNQVNGDLKIYHNGSHSYIADVGTGVLSIESNGENIALHDSANARNMARFTVGGAASLNWAGGTGTGTKLATTAAGIDVTGAVKSTKGFYTDYKNHGDFPTTDSWYTIAICKGRDAVTTIQRASGEFIVVDNTDAAGHETVRFTASELFAQDALISVSEYLSYSATSINRFRIKSGNAFEGSALQVYASATAADLGVTLINDPYLQSNEGGWHLLDAPVIDSSDPSTLEGAGRTLGYAAGDDVNVRAWDWTNFTSKADTGFLNNPTGLTTTSGVSVGGNLEVTGTVTADGVTLDNNQKIKLGGAATPNLEIYETTAGHGLIVQNGAGDLIVKGANYEVRDDDENLRFKATTGVTGAAYLYHGEDGTNKLATTATGIDVKGTIECDTSLQIQSSGSSVDAMPDLYMTNVETAADAQNLGMIHFRGYNDASTPTIESYANIYAQQVDVSDGTEKGKLVFQARNGAGYVEALQVNKDGIDVTGTVKGDSLTIDNGAGLTTAYINSATGASILTVKSTYEGGTEWQNVGVIEVGGHDKAYIDLKKPDTDDTDLRLLHDGNGSLTAFDGDLFLQTSSSNSSGKVALRNGGSAKLETTATGINVTGTVEADAFSGTGNTAITDFITDVSASNNDTTVPTTAAVKSYVDNNDGDTTYTGGTGLTLDGTTFNVDAAQTQITSLGTLSGLTTGATTVNGPLIATNDYHQFRSTNTTQTNMPLIEVFRDKEITASGSTPLGGFVFTGRNEDDRKVSYGSFFCNSTGQDDDGEHKASLVFTVADGSGAADPFTNYTDNSFQSGHSVALNIGADYFITTGYLKSNVGELKLGGKQSILESPDAYNDQSSYDLHMPNAAKAKVMSIGGMGPFDGFIGANQSVAQMLQYRGQHMVSSGGPFEFELPACVASSTISTSTANVGDIWQITNIYGSAITIDRDGSGTTQNVYYLPSLTLSAFTNNPTLAVGGTMTLQAVSDSTWLILNYTGLTDA